MRGERGEKGTVEASTARSDGGESPEPGRELCLSILRKAPDGFVLLDGKGRYRYMNPAFTRITGYTLEDLPDISTWFECACPNPTYRQKVHELRQELFSGNCDSMVVTIVRKDGRVREIEARRTPIDDDCILLSVMDVTEQTLIEESLQQTASELSAVIDSFPDLFLRLNADGTILDTRAGRLVERPMITRAHLGQRVQDLLPPGGSEAFLGALREAVRTNARTAPIEFECRAEGETRCYEARVVPLHGTHLMAIIRDITERKRAEEELQRYREHLEEVVAERTAELRRANEQLEHLVYCIEVTERKAAERWLDRSAEKGTVAVDEPESVRITTNETGTIIIADLTAERLSGFSRDELVGKTVWSLFSGGGVRETLSREVLEGGRSAECSEGVALVRKDGSKEAVHITAEPIKSGAGAVIGMICTLRKG